MPNRVREATGKGGENRTGPSAEGTLMREGDRHIRHSIKTKRAMKALLREEKEGAPIEGRHANGDEG